MTEEQGKKVITFSRKFIALLHLGGSPRAMARMIAEAAAVTFLDVAFDGSIPPNVEDANKVSATIEMTLDYFYGEDEVPLHA